MNQKTFEQLAGDMDKKELICVLGEIVQLDEDAEEIFLLHYQNRIKQSPENFALVNQSLLIKYWQNALQIIDSANEYGGCSDDDMDDAFAELESLMQLVQEHDFPWHIRKTVLDGMLQQIAYDNSGFTDELVDCAEEICQSTEEELYLAEFLAAKGNDYYRKYAANIFRKHGDQNRALIIQKANLEYSTDYLELAKMYDEMGDYQSALTIARNGLNSKSGRLNSTYQYLFAHYQSIGDMHSLWDLYHVAIQKNRDVNCIAELMYGFSTERGDYPHQKELLIKLLETCHHNEIRKWYNQCLFDFRSDDWLNEEDKILKMVKARNMDTYLTICMEKGNYSEVMDQVLSVRRIFKGWDLDEGHRYSKNLIEIFPNEVLQLYWQEVGTLIQLGKDTFYKQAANTLKEIKELMQKMYLTDEWEQKFAKLKLEQKRRRNFLREIAEL